MITSIEKLQGDINAIRLRLNNIERFVDAYFDDNSYSLFPSTENISRTFIDNTIYKLNLKITRSTISAGSVKFSYKDIQEYGDTIGALNEIFLKKAYNYLDVEDRVVLDIGANIGDTALYFHSKKAAQIYALEPFPFTFEKLERNLKLNGAGVALNAGVLDKDGFVKIPQDYESNNSDELRHSPTGKKVYVYSLKTLVEKYGIKDAVLKMDCEGAEYLAILKSTKKTLRHFRQIQIEYHYGYKELVNYLAVCGFKVRHTVPIHAVNARARNKDMYYGFIYGEQV